MQKSPKMGCLGQIYPIKGKNPNIGGFELKMSLHNHGLVKGCTDECLDRKHIVERFKRVTDWVRPHLSYFLMEKSMMFSVDADTPTN